MLDPPIVIMQAVRRAVRRWRFGKIALMFPELLPDAPDIVVPQQVPPGSVTHILALRLLTHSSTAEAMLLALSLRIGSPNVVGICGPPSLADNGPRLGLLLCVRAGPMTIAVSCALELPEPLHIGLFVPP